MENKPLSIIKFFILETAVNVSAWTWLQSINIVLSTISLCLAIGYGVWKWNKDYKEKKGKNNGSY